jgi:hypothetical protein
MEIQKKVEKVEVNMGLTKGDILALLTSLNDPKGMTPPAHAVVAHVPADDKGELTAESPLMVSWSEAAVSV